MRRRDFLTLTAGLAWPVASSAQEPRRLVGFLGSTSVPSPGGLQSRNWWGAFLDGIKEQGFLEQRNLNILYRSAEGEYERLAGLAAELVNRGVDAIVCADAPASHAAKAATRTIPIIFLTGADPVKLGLIESFSRPGGNLTGVSIIISSLAPKRLELVRELLPTAGSVALLLNPKNPNARAYEPQTQAAAEMLGLRLDTLNASTEAELEAAFADVAAKAAGALIVMPDPFFIAQRDKLVMLAARQALPAIYPIREYIEVGGLMSYGTRVAELLYEVGKQTGKILRGARPADLPVLQSTKLELVINLKAAKTLGLTVPAALLARADEVVE